MANASRNQTIRELNDSLQITAQLISSNSAFHRSITESSIVLPATKRRRLTSSRIVSFGGFWRVHPVETPRNTLSKVNVDQLREGEKEADPG
jgi:hypothetical protein